MKFFRYAFLVHFFAILCSTAFAQEKKQHTFDIKSPKELKEFFRYTPDRIPLVCGHRGGAQSLYPENSIAGLEYILSEMPAFFEIDPRLTKDSVAVVLHDATLDRTTTGTGKLSDYTWEEVKKLKLKDKKGKVTAYGIHTLDEVLQWAKGKTIIMIDKKDVPLAQTYEIIKRNNAQNHVLISAYTPEEALFYHKLDKNLMFEAFITNLEKFKAFEATNIPWENIVAYLSQSRTPELYNELHKRGVMCMFYTAKTIEKNKDKELRIQGYKAVINGGADIILSDRAFEAYQAIQEFNPKKSRKEKYFNINK